jgi:hypothetical protein
MWAGRLLLLLLATAGVEPGRNAPASANVPRSAGAGGAGGADAAEAACAVEAPSARLTVTEMPHGVMLSYATEPNLVGAVQRLVRDFADRQDGGSPVGQRVGDPRLHGGLAAAPPGTNVLVPGSHATVTNTTTGARLTLDPVSVPVRALLRAASQRQGQLASVRPCPPDLRLTPAPPDAPDTSRSR